MVIDIDAFDYVVSLWLNTGEKITRGQRRLMLCRVNSIRQIRLPYLQEQSCDNW